MLHNTGRHVWKAEAAAVYSAFIFVMILLQALLNGAGPRTIPASNPGLPGEVRVRGGVVDLTALCAALDRDLLPGLALRPRNPGQPADNATHEWHLGHEIREGVEWRWTEANHEIALAEAGSLDDFERLSAELKARWPAGEVEGVPVIDGNDMVLALQFHLAVALNDGTSMAIPVSYVTIRQRIGTASTALPKAKAPEPPLAVGHDPTNRTAERPKPIPVSPRPETPSVKEKPEPGRPRLCIVIDDVGESTPEQAAEFFKVPYPLTFAVLPFAPHSRAQAIAAAASGREVILHLPMEPEKIQQHSPGPGAILVSQSDEEVIRRVREALDSVPEAIGINNHMGSLATTDRRVMSLMMGEVQRSRLFFLDSWTISRSVGAEVAQKMRVPSARRNVFLDNIETEEAVTNELNRAVRIAKKQGFAIAIGHMNRPVTARVLAKLLPRIAAMGIDIVPLSRMVH